MNYEPCDHQAESTMVQLFYALKVVMGFIFFLSLVHYHHLSCLYNKK